MQKNRYNQRYWFRERVVDGQTYRHTSQVSQNPCALLGSNKRVFLPETWFWWMTCNVLNMRWICYTTPNWGVVFCIWSRKLFAEIPSENSGSSLPVFLLENIYEYILWLLRFLGSSWLALIHVRLFIRRSLISLRFEPGLLWSWCTIPFCYPPQSWFGPDSIWSSELASAIQDIEDWGNKWLFNYSAG